MERFRVTVVAKSDFIELLTHRLRRQKTSPKKTEAVLETRLAEFKVTLDVVLPEMTAHRDRFSSEVKRLSFHGSFVVSKLKQLVFN